MTDLFTPPSQAHSATSQAAATAIRPVAQRDRERIRGLFVAAGDSGLTDEEIVTATGLNPSTARPRRIDLVKEGAVRDSHRTRPTRSNRPATVWVAVEFYVPPVNPVHAEPEAEPLDFAAFFAAPDCRLPD